MPHGAILLSLVPPLRICFHNILQLLIIKLRLRDLPTCQLILLHITLLHNNRLSVILDMEVTADLLNLISFSVFTLPVNVSRFHNIVEWPVLAGSLRDLCLLLRRLFLEVEVELVGVLGDVAGGDIQDMAGVVVLLVVVLAAGVLTHHFGSSHVYLFDVLTYHS